MARDADGGRPDRHGERRAGRARAGTVRGRSSGHAVITGGAGFIGTNVASRLVEDGMPVVVLDNLSRPGVERNLNWLLETYGTRVRFEQGDIRDREVLRRVLPGARKVIHLAAQVAVTTSLDEPLHDFGVNAEGTITLLEELRRLDRPPFLLFTSTNKVYGSLPDLPLELVDNRWSPSDPALRERGLSEAQPLDFCTPYGCSKGAADQYVLDYAKSYGLPAVVFRMSCIYGPHQHGTEDQGWVAHFAIKNLRGEPITLYGDGARVRRRPAGPRHPVRRRPRRCDVARARACRDDGGPRVQHGRRSRECGVAA